MPKLWETTTCGRVTVAAPNASTKQRGDQLVKLSVQLPDTIDDELRTFVERWAKDHPYDVRGKLGIA